MSRRKSFKGQFSMCVQPTFLIGTYDENQIPNFAPITWLSVTWDTDQHLLIISMLGSKKTKKNILLTKQFSANLVSTDMLHLVDYFSSCSGNDGIKNEISYDFSQGEVLQVPTLDQSKWVYECEVRQVVQTGDSDTFFCNIRNIQIDERIDLTKRLDLTQLDPVIYSGKYHSIKNCLGDMGDFYSRAE